MKRILSLFSVLFLVTLVTFIMTNLAPSDSAEMYYLSKGITPSEEVLNETRHEMGLDKNIVVRYVDWLNDFVQGDLVKHNVDDLGQISEKNNDCTCGIG